MDLHPTGAARARIVRTPGLLMRAGWVPALAAGMVMSVGLTYLVAPLANLMSEYRAGLVLASVVLGSVAAEVTGSGLWRATAAALARGERLPSGIREGAGLAAGIVAGQVLAPEQAGSLLTARFQHDVPSALVCVGLLLVTCLLFTRWAVAGGAVWIAAARGARLVVALRAGRVVMALAFGAGVGAVLGALVGSEPNAVQYVIQVLATVIVDPFVQPALVVASAYPLTAALRGGTPAGRAVDLDGDAEPVVLPGPRLRPGWVVGVPVRRRARSGRPRPDRVRPGSPDCAATADRRPERRPRGDSRATRVVPARGSLTCAGGPSVEGTAPPPEPGPARTVPAADVCAELARQSTGFRIDGFGSDRYPAPGALAMGADDPGTARLGEALWTTASSRSGAYSRLSLNALTRWCIYPG